MMQVSDNMLAEQLLLLTGLAQNDTLSAVFSISHAKTNLLRDLIDSPIWVDGSGLSKYNMMTPRSITQLLKKMHQQTDEQRLFSLMAIGGQNGSLRNMFKSTDGPYIFAKTGSLAAVYNLSGYMITRSGRKLIFSFMNNNFSGSATPVRKEVERVLNLVREKY
jgi:D-alanyl-D-alanine carboxypeptidase/D-alanyl-D-alanine-endopeptidase (penicillin-binding protein 4)